MPTVAVVKGEDRRGNIRSVLKSLPDETWIKLESAKSILIKPNLVHHLNQLASSHVDSVRGVIDVIRDKSQAPIIVGDASYRGTKAAFRNFGYENLSDEYENVSLFDLNDDETVPGYYIKRNGSQGEMGKSKLALQSDFKISLTQMKTHRDVGVSLTTKNWTIGTWVPEPRYGVEGKYWPRWPFLHEQGQLAHNETIAELLKQMKPDLVIADGFIGMEGDGPTRGNPIDARVAVAGRDSIAVDATACRIMDIDPMDIGYLAIASKRGYGVVDEDAIEMISESHLEEMKKPFVKPETWADHVLSWKQ